MRTCIGWCFKKPRRSLLTSPPSYRASSCEAEYAGCSMLREWRCGVEIHLKGKWLPRDFIKLIWPPILTEFRRGGEEKAQKWDEHLLDQTKQLSFAAHSRIHTQTHTHTHTQAQTKTDTQHGIDKKNHMHNIHQIHDHIHICNTKINIFEQWMIK